VASNSSQGEKHSSTRSGSDSGYASSEGGIDHGEVVYKGRGRLPISEPDGEIDDDGGGGLILSEAVSNLQDSVISDRPGSDKGSNSFESGLSECSTAVSSPQSGVATHTDPNEEDAIGRYPTETEYHNLAQSSPQEVELSPESNAGTVIVTKTAVAPTYRFKGLSPGNGSESEEPVTPTRVTRPSGYLPGLAVHKTTRNSRSSQMGATNQACYASPPQYRRGIMKAQEIVCADDDDEPFRLNIAPTHRDQEKIQGSRPLSHMDEFAHLVPDKSDRDIFASPPKWNRRHMDIPPDAFLRPLPAQVHPWTLRTRARRHKENMLSSRATYGMTEWDALPTFPSSAQARREIF
jgi:hypothetical protein